MSSDGRGAQTSTTAGVSAVGRAGGEMGDRIRSFDWACTPLGPIESWPQSLRTTVNILLSSRYAMWMCWGPRLTMLYNDAYAPTLGIKHPTALGRPASDVWAEIWSDIGSRVDAVLGEGASTYDEGLLLFLERSGFPEETYHTFSYSPIANDEGRTSGMLCVVTEETERQIGARRLATLGDVASALAGTNTEDEVLRELTAHLAHNRKDLPFTLAYLYDETGAARLGASSGIIPGSPLAPERIDPANEFPWPARQILEHPAARVIHGLGDLREAGSIPAGGWNKPADQAAIVPIRQQGQEIPAGFFVVGVNPYRRYDAAYSGFVDLVAGQIAAGLANARTYEAERKRAEALAEIDRAKTIFFSNVSHELRTPLTLMLSPVEELLGAPTRQGTDERELLSLVHRNGLRLQRLVNNLLDFTRIEAGRAQGAYEPVDLARLTTDLASNFRSAMEKAGLQFTIDCRPLPQPVYVDREMWEKIVLNLLSNALKFTFHGSVRVRLAAHADSVQLSVEDTGTGIPPQELPRIFDRFHRIAGAKGRTIEGTGIGLALVQELTALHGGAVAAASELGQGSTFTVTLHFGTAHLPQDKIRPASAPQWSSSRSDAFVDEAFRWLSTDGAASHLPGETAGRPIGRSAPTERVLLADDNADMRDYITRLLRERYVVDAVANGEEALQAALAAPPDLVLSDVMMPVRDGFGLLQKLRELPETRTIPVILLSARAGEESRIEGLDAGADDYLIKPFTARELLSRVGAHLAMRRRTMEAEAALKESQATLQSFYDSSPFLMGVTELEGDEIIAIYRNAATAGFYGKDRNRFSVMPRAELCVPRAVDDIWVRHYRESQALGRTVRFEYQHPLPGGICWMNASVGFLGYGPSGRPRFSFIAEDITDRKTSDQLLRRSNDELRRANADLEQFAYSASHDMQEPLRQIAIYSQLLDKKYSSKLDGKASEYLGFCIEGAQRMGMLISGLLAYSQVARSSETPKGPVSIAEVLETVKKNLSAIIDETGAEIVISPMPTVRGEAVPLVHLFQNLVGNALKYRGPHKPLVHIGATEFPDHWMFSVADNGIGISKEFHNQIFGIFKRLHDRTDYPGTGIGLAICQKIVERSGGRIWVESEPGEGSTFFFTLPTAP